MVFCLLSANEGFAAAEIGRVKRYHPGRILVQPRELVARQSVAEVGRAKGQERRTREITGRTRLQVIDLEAGEKVEEVVKKFRQSGLVEFAEPDYLVKLQALPNDPEFQNGNQWGLRNTGQNGGGAGSDISGVSAWDTLTSASNVVVAVIDTGVRYTHQDLAANMWRNPGEIAGNNKDDDGNGFVDDVHGMDAVNETGNPMDFAGHGTHVAGILGAVGNNGKGVCGVAWQVKIMALRFFDDTGYGATSDAIQCIEYARNNGAHILNASWGGEEYSEAFKRTLESARNAGMILVTSAGNENSNNDSVAVYPGNYDLDNIVVVAGTDRRDSLDLSYSNYGAETVDLAAPGSMIYSTWANWDGSYTYLSGTSMAAPFVSGALALLKARFPDENERALIERLYASTDPLEGLRGLCKTGGRLNLARAVGPALVASFEASRYAGFFPLSIGFTNTTFGEHAGVLWDFGDGTDSTEANPTHEFGPGTFPVKLTVTATDGSTSSYAKTVTVRPGYNVLAGASNWISASDVSLGLGDNGISPAIALPFEFQFFGTNYAQIYVSANGIAGFRAGNLGTTLFSGLPTLGDPGAFIAAYWDDFNPVLGGQVAYGLRGTAPNRRFVVSWLGIPKSGTDLSFTFQMVLEEESGAVVINYQQVNAHDARGGGRQAFIGIEDESGLLGVPFVQLGQPRILANGESVRFSPVRMGFLQVKKPSKSRVQARVGATTGISPLEFELVNTGTGNLDWGIENPADWISLSSFRGVLGAGASTNVILTLNEQSNELPAGSFDASLLLRNVSSGLGSSAWTFGLDLYQPINLVPTLAEGEMRISWQAGGAGMYVVEASEDLLQWVPVQTNTVETVSQLPINVPASAAQRFFRIRQQ